MEKGKPCATVLDSHFKLFPCIGDILTLSKKDLESVQNKDTAKVEIDEAPIVNVNEDSKISTHETTIMAETVQEVDRIVPISIILASKMEKIPNTSGISNINEQSRATTTIDYKISGTDSLDRSVNQCCNTSRSLYSHSA